MLIYYGYTGAIAEYLNSRGIKPGDRVVVKLKDDTILRGIVLSRPQLYPSESVLVIKLSNGYNIGLSIEKIKEITKIEDIGRTGLEARVSSIHESKNERPRVTLISTGGTIASKVDYDTGAVTPALKPEEILEWIPELGEIAVVSSREIMSIFSEDMTPSHWSKIAEEVYKEIMSGVNGVVVAHGTDTMSYTASAIAFAIRNKPVPIVFVGSQRSSDRPSTDAVFNLLSSFIVASKAPFAESVIVMHGESSDRISYVHRGVKARKMHTSRRDAFQSINDRPIAIVEVPRGEIKITGQIYEYRGEKEPVLNSKFDDKVALVKVYPGLQEEIIDLLVDGGFHGIVLEGTGLGHAPNRIVDSIKRAVENNIPVVMTSQCLFGHVDMFVYSTGRRLLEAGVIPAYDMLPETAYVKLSWILGSITRDLEQVRDIFTRNLVGEINYRHTPDLYPRWDIEY